MISYEELNEAIKELENLEPSLQVCGKLASLYIILDHLYKVAEPYTEGYSYESKEIGLYGDSEFLRAIEGKPQDELFILIDELLETVRILTPRLYDAFMNKL